MHSSFRVLAVAAAIVGATAVPTGATRAATQAAMPSDFDGDGYADLAVGAPGEDIGTKQDAGAVNVLYGSTAGLSGAGDQLWSQDATGVLGTSEGGPVSSGKAGDAFGTALASGDFDRDGFADLAIGVPLDRVGTATYVGAVNVLYGSARGLTAAGNQRWSQGNLADDPDQGDGFGGSLGTADFDGDGFWDLAIGVPGEDLGVGQAPGIVQILYGSADGLSAAGATVLTRAMTGAPYLADTPHGFGYALAAGDLDGDGLADLAVGAPASGVGGDDPGRLVDGEVDVFYGTAAGVTAVDSQLWTQDSAGVPGEGEEGDWFGSALTLGDYDRDGFGDLAIGARFDRVGAIRAGAVNVLYGSGAGLTATDGQWLHQNLPGVPGTAEAGDAFGHALASGDLDGDGASDLAIGAPGESIGSPWPGAGGINVMYGSGTGLTAAGSQFWSQDSAGVPGTAEASEFAWDSFGASLAASNYGRSGHDDLAIGAHLERLGAARDTGMVDVLYGRAAGLAAAAAQAWSQDSPGVKGAAESRDYFGVSLTP
jgi:hypothetical protein